MIVVHLVKSHRPNKKYQVLVKKMIHFGDSKYEDYTMHNDEKRKERYLSRHQKREDWSINGINTSGFWSRFLLWNKPSIEESIEDIKNRFGINVIFTKSDWMKNK